MNPAHPPNRSSSQLQISGAIVLNASHSTYVWDGIWGGDIYSLPLERKQRAAKRAAALQLFENIGTHESVLDIGCGSADLLSILFDSRDKNGGMLVGLERSGTALDLAAKRNGDSDVYLVSGDATKLPFGDDSFDNVLLFGVMEHISDSHVVLSEARRVLRSSGRVFITSSNAMSALQLKNFALDRVGRYRYGYQKNWTRKSLVRLVEQFFDVEEQFVLQCDADMPLVLAIDSLIGKIFSGWGRYICIRAKRC